MREKMREGENKNKRNKKKRRKKEPNHKTSLPNPTSCYFVEQRRRIGEIECRRVDERERERKKKEKKKTKKVYSINFSVAAAMC